MIDMKALCTCSTCLYFRGGCCHRMSPNCSGEWPKTNPDELCGEYRNLANGRSQLCMVRASFRRYVNGNDTTCPARP
jgi:hypothetical protein